MLHAINYLLGRLDRRYLTTLRQFGGLQSYPSRTKDPDPVDYSTGSVGLGATAPIWGALAHRYVAGHFDVPGRRAPDRADRRRRARRGRLLGGDRRPDGGRASARSCGSSTSTASRSTASCPTSPPAAWPRCSRPPAGTCVMVKYGAAAARARAGAARAHRRDAQRGVPAAAARRRARAARAARGRRADDLDDARAAGHVPRPRRPRPRRAARRLPPGRRGARPPERRLRLHDQGLAAADRGPPGQPLGAAHRRAVRASWPARSAPTRRTRGRRSPTGTPGGRAVREPRPAARAPGRRVRRRRRRRCPTTSAASTRGTASTQQAFGRFFVDLVREAPEVAARVVTVSPDVGTSTNLGGWINKAGHLVARRPDRLVRRRHRHARALARDRPRPPHRARASPRSTSSACSASSARRGRATASRCCRSARSTTRSSRARSSRGRSASTPAASRSSSARRAASRSGPRAAPTSR